MPKHTLSMLDEDIFITVTKDKMAATASALDRVLKLPELLSTILGCLYNDTPTLAACIRVNKLWAEEAVMYLWETCGSISEPIQGEGRTPPRMRHLAALAPYPDRLQWYARCIRRLEFSVKHRRKGVYDRPIDISRVDAQYHLAFANTEFPRLGDYAYGILAVVLLTLDIQPCCSTCSLA